MAMLLPCRSSRTTCKQEGNVVRHGACVEVSLVLKGANPKGDNQNVTMYSDGEGYSAIIKMGEGDVSLNRGLRIGLEDESLMRTRPSVRSLSHSHRRTAGGDPSYLIAAAIDGSLKTPKETEETEGKYAAQYLWG